MQVFVVECDGVKHHVETPVLCRYRTAKLDCTEQAMCAHGYCAVHCWERGCKRKRARGDVTAPLEQSDDFATGDLGSNSDSVGIDMDSTGDSKHSAANAIDSSADSPPGGIVDMKDEPPLCQLCDERPAVPLESEEAAYTAWLNGNHLVTARQSGEDFAMIMPCKRDAFEVRA